jgi:plasmid maintenance system antidote protein VapI
MSLRDLRAAQTEYLHEELTAAGIDSQAAARIIKIMETIIALLIEERTGT